MPNVKVLIGFTTAPDPVIEDTAGAVLKGMTGNAAFPHPPVAMAALEAARDAFVAGIVAQAQGGTLATAKKKDAREALITLLRDLARYVQMNCNDDLAALLSSGFTAANPSRARQELTKPSNPILSNGQSGQLLAKVKPIPNAKCYEARYAAVGADGTVGPLQSGGLSTDSRAIAINGLMPGTMYQVEIRAVVGSTGYSGWCDPVQHMSM